MSARTDASSSRGILLSCPDRCSYFDARALTQSPVSLCGVFLSSCHAEDWRAHFLSHSGLSQGSLWNLVSAHSHAEAPLPTQPSPKERSAAPKWYQPLRAQAKPWEELESLWATSHQGSLTLRMSGAHTQYLHTSISIYIYIKRYIYIAYRDFIHIYVHNTKSTMYRASHPAPRWRTCFTNGTWSLHRSIDR